MEKTIDPNTGTVHIIDRTDKTCLFLICKCREETGINWVKADEDAVVNCLICRQHDTDAKEEIDDWNIIVDKDECEFMLPSNHKGPNHCNYGENVVPCIWDNCNIKSSLL